MENANVNEVKVFGVFYHSHLTGRGMMLQHLRYVEIQVAEKGV